MVYNETGAHIIQRVDMLTTSAGGILPTVGETKSHFQSPIASTSRRAVSWTTPPNPHLVAHHMFSYGHQNSATPFQSYECSTSTAYRPNHQTTVSPLQKQFCTAAVSRLGVVSQPAPTTGLRLSPQESSRTTRIDITSSARSCTYKQTTSGCDPHSSSDDAYSKEDVAQRMRKEKCETPPMVNIQSVSVPMLARLDCNLPSWVASPPSAHTRDCDSKVTQSTSATVSTCSISHDGDDEECAVRFHPTVYLEGKKSVSITIPSFSADRRTFQESRTNLKKKTSTDGSSSSLIDPWSSRLLLPAASREGSSSHDCLSGCSINSGPRLATNLPSKLDHQSGNSLYSQSILDLMVNVEKKLTENRELYDMVDKLCPTALVKPGDNDTVTPVTSDTETVSGTSVDEGELVMPIAIHRT
mmetsp:Transcript_109582/g.173085  ORF Transcript_109582/g.173085 Transcript_109582/m.173085 type:complete len:413 (-) Transcript_109582:280-1518(-)